MRQRLALAGQDPDAVTGPASLAPLQESPSPTTALARAKALQRGLEGQAQQRRN